MEMTGEYQVPAKRQTVWAALQDPEILKTCLPDCEALARNADGSLSGKIGGAEGGFAGDIVFSNAVRGESLTANGEAKGGEAGSLRGGVDVTLSDRDDGTLIRYKLRTQLGGKLAQLGSRHIDSAAKAIAGDFFGAFAARLAEEPTIAAPPLATPGGEEAAEDELVGRLEQRVDDAAEDVGGVAEEVEEEIEAAAGRGFLGGPYVWGLIALLALIVILAILR